MEDPLLLQDMSIESVSLNAHPLVVALTKKLGIIDVLNEKLPKDPRSKVSDAQCVSAMVLNILSGRTALYRMESWTNGLPVELLFGQGCQSSDFNDERFANCLDNIFQAGTDTLLSSIVEHYLTSEDRTRTYSIHQDSTTLSLFGVYDTTLPEWAPSPKHGHSKDHRPDLKQLVFGLTLHGATGMPIISNLFDGNTSDKHMNSYHIETLSTMLPEEDEITLVADSKLVDASILGALLQNEMNFISLVPRTYNNRAKAIELLLAHDEEAPILGQSPKRKKGDPDKVYRGRSFNLHFSVKSPGEKKAKPKELRFLAIHSDAQKAKFIAGLDSRLAKEQKKIEASISKANKNPFTCEEDAQRALNKIVSSAKFHTVNAKIEMFEEPGKRPKGRPRKDSPAPTMTKKYRFKLESCEKDETSITKEQVNKSHFVLITNHLNHDTHPDRWILSEYRHQQVVEGNTGFRWLKGPARVTPMFLKKPERIAALGFVFILALLVRNYLQFMVRKSLKESGETVPYYDRKKVTAKPTAEVVWDLFSDLVLITVKMPKVKPVLRLQGLTEAHIRILKVFGWDNDVLIAPLKTSTPSG